jgi:DNA-binding IclR family transcriptional regulator
VVGCACSAPRMAFSMAEPGDRSVLSRAGRARSSAAQRPSGDGPRYPIESVDNALRLLLLVGREGSVSVSAAGRYLGVAPSTAHRLLAMLQHYRLIEQDPERKTYRIGPGLAELGLTALRDFDIRAAARPHLSRLVDEVGETAHLVMLHGSDVLFLDCVECNAPVRATPRTGQRLPAHCTAGGKIQLAYLAPDQIIEMYPDEKLPGLTDQSIVKRSDLLRDLQKDRRAGFATNRRESEADVHAVAAAIVDSAGMVRGAFTVSGPPERMPQSRLREIGTAVQRAAEGVAAGIG